MVWNPGGGNSQGKSLAEKHKELGQQYYGMSDKWSPTWPHSFTTGRPEWMWAQYSRDPMMAALQGRVTEDFEKDYRGQYMQQANVGIDQQLASIGQALAGRGGGGFGSAIGMGAQARSSALLGALGQAESARAGAQDRYAGFLSDRYNVMNQIMGGYLGQVQSAVERKGQRTGLEASKWQTYGQFVPGGGSGLY